MLQLFQPFWEGAEKVFEEMNAAGKSNQESVAKSAVADTDAVMAES